MVDVKRVTIAATILCACNAFAKSLLSTSSSDEDIEPDAKKNNKLAIVLFKDKKPQSGQQTSESYNGKAYTRVGKSELKNTNHKKLAPGLNLDIDNLDIDNLDIDNLDIDNLELDNYAEIELDDDADIDLDEATDSSDSDDDSDILSVEVLRKSHKTSKKACKTACKIATTSVCEKCDCSAYRKKSMAKKCYKKCKKDVD